ncbi:MAG: FAD-dependent oxidoreductase, partial [Halarsenatibacteraceae bacterium]
MAEKEAKSVVEFLQEELEGMKDIEFIGIADEFYVRETRHFVTEKQLDVRAQLTASIPVDTVALASYPLDYQSYAPGSGGFVYFNPGIYGKPLSSLIPVDFDNLLIVGRTSGQSSIAHSSGRIVPNGMVAAEGAGLAIAKAMANKIRPKAVADSPALMAEIQSQTELASQLNSRNIRNLQRELVPENYLETVAELLSWGLIVGGYDNNFRLEDNLVERTFVYIILNGLRNRDATVENANLSNQLTTISSPDQLLKYNKV